MKAYFQGVHAPARVAFWCYVLFGLWLLPDFGVPLDELTQRGIGIVNNQFISRGDMNILEHRYYGPIFETGSFWLEQVFGIRDARSYLLLRHFLLFLICSSSLIAIYRVVFGMYGSVLTAFFAAGIYALHPRIFADNFYNSKDSLFMALFAWALWHLFVWLKDSGMRSFVGFCVLSGIMSTLRIQGLYLPVLAGLSWLFLYRPDWKVAFRFGLWGIGITLLSLLAFYPYLWLNPIENFREVLFTASRFPWPWGTLTDGVYLWSKHTPWWYLPLWMLATTPALFVLFLVAGLIPLRFTKWQWMLWLLLLIPVLLAIFMHAPMYDGWRHYYFLWPICAILTGAALHLVHSLKTLQQSLAALTLAIALFHVVRGHPLQMCFFNEIYPSRQKQLHERWELDYWGLGYRSALEKMIEGRSDSIRVYAWDDGIWNNMQIMTLEQRRKILLVPRDSAEFLIENIRGPKRQGYPGTIVYSLQPYGDTTLVVFKQP
ncbi:MAG: hypothetical protein KJS92_04205 [Bacteroidetes bacterium]|nr:hypothetical protein [Bacteroidota bacterium]